MSVEENKKRLHNTLNHRIKYIFGVAESLAAALATIPSYHGKEHILVLSKYMIGMFKIITAKIKEYL